ncbi:MAG: hypothetical protein EAS52_04075 [Parapedobacter sp.]|nr:MAG: hypothetical protein EAS52_04075 [Parapedobacter sp.]
MFKANNKYGTSKGILTANEVTKGFEGDTVKIHEVTFSNGYQRAKGILSSVDGGFNGMEVSILNHGWNTIDFSLKEGETYPRSLFKPLLTISKSNPFDGGECQQITNLLELCVDTDTNTNQYP